MRPVIVVMVKAPRAGLVKTRLAPPLSELDAASLAACMAQDSVGTALRVVRDVIVAYAPSNGRAPLEALLPDGLLWFEQRGADLGARLEGAVAQAMGQGFSPVIVTGADSPTLPASFIEQARDRLAACEADVALGPTKDGGYYLVGLQRPVPGLFQNVDWSTPLAYEQTARNAARSESRLLQLPAWYDVDTFSDLLRLRDEIFSDSAARSQAQATYRWMLAHDLPHPS
ncbi:MAG: TIGR04282 family arsenosugar biosynthesis glycosyltransferase [Pyrinomonadaceae bacterium]